MVLETEPHARELHALAIDGIIEEEDISSTLSSPPPRPPSLDKVDQNARSVHVNYNP